MKNACKAIAVQQRPSTIFAELVTATPKNHTSDLRIVHEPGKR
jgi:hypothetical protein